jgi:hypothetical protein
MPAAFQAAARGPSGAAASRPTRTTDVGMVGSPGSEWGRTRMARSRGLPSLLGMPPSLALEPEILPIHTRGLTERYGATVALDGVDLGAAGKVCSLPGPNRAGKTTAIRLWLGLHRPIAGQAELIDGRGDLGTARWRASRHRHRLSPRRSPADCLPDVISCSATDTHAPPLDTHSHHRREQEP